MTDIKTRAQGIDPNLNAKDIKDLAGRTGNLYEALSIVSKRARQLNAELKTELHQKLDEFAVVAETIEEIHENKEQIEISKFYERLPNPTVIAMKEFMNDELDYSYKNGQVKETEEF